MMLSLIIPLKNASRKILNLARSPITTDFCLALAACLRSHQELQLINTECAKRLFTIRFQLRLK